MRGSNNDTAPLLQLTGVQKNYQMGVEVVRALQDIDLTINEGEYVAIMGHSGSGKSTMMNILGCLDKPTAGTYVLGGTDVSALDDNRLAEVRNREIGFVFQTFNLLPRMSARANVELPLIYSRMPAAKRREQADQALDRVGLAHRKGHKPNELSGGERQRVAIARALVNSPSIVLADEPTGNLDTKTSEEIMGVLNNLHAQGNTIILVTHEEDISKHAHRRIHLRDGRIIDDELTGLGRTTINGTASSSAEKA